MMPKKPSRLRTMIRPINEMPSCFFMTAPLFCSRTLCFSLLTSHVLPLLDPAADALQVAEIHPHQEGASLDVVVGHEPPVTAVAALVAVVAHHEIASLRHRAAEAVVIGFAIVPMGELQHLREIHM